MNKQIEALKMAVEAEKTGNLQDLVDAVNMLVDVVEALAEAEKQEPVQIQYFDAIYETWKNTEKEYVEHYKDNRYEIRYLYTHPATWQSLSDEEVNKIADKCYTLQTSVSDYEFNEFEFYRAIEQALKEKNT